MAGRFETLWYEDMEGNYLGPGTFESFPEGAEVQVSRFPFELQTTYLRLKEDGGSEKLFTANSSYNPGLMLAMIRPSVREMFRQLIRYGRFTERQEPNTAVLLAAETCERCMNSLAHRYGLDWGYREGSDEWHLTGTTCFRCEGLGRGKFWVRAETGDEEFPYRWSLTEEGRVGKP